MRDSEPWEILSPDSNRILFHGTASERPLGISTELDSGPKFEEGTRRTRFLSYGWDVQRGR